MTAANPDVTATATHGAGADTQIHAVRRIASPAVSWQRLIRRRLAMIDTVSVLLAAGLAFIIAESALTTASIAAMSVAVVAGSAVAAAWMGALAWTRQRDASIEAGGRAQFWPVLAAGGVILATAGLMVSMFEVVAPRTILIFPVLLGTAVAAGGRLYARQLLKTARRDGRCHRNVLLVGGATELATYLAPTLGRFASSARIVGVCLTDSATASKIVTTGRDGLPATIPVLGAADEVAAIAAAVGADTVVLSQPDDVDSISALAWDLDKVGASVSVGAPHPDIARSRAHTERIGASAFTHIDRPQYRAARGAGKRALDIVGALGLLIGFALPMMLIAAAVKLTSRGPVLFRQDRVGLDGEYFRMLKFRSMVADADERLAALQQQQDAGNVIMFKMKKDPRITAIGKIIRRVSLDELPQLFNVLRGDMSLVGPRPPLASEVASYDDDTRERRFLVKPGITGLWQVSGRSDLDWDETVRCDRDYVENWTLTGDISILLRTAGAMGKGAY